MTGAQKTAESILNYCAKELKIPNASANIKIERAHIILRFEHAKMRPIVVKLKMCVNLNSLAELIMRETTHVDIVMVWLLPLLNKNTPLLLSIVTKRKYFF